MSEYKVKFEVFEGPLDLLLYLIKKQEVDIYDVNLTNLAAQFIEYVEFMRMLDLDIAGEFVVMASTLMLIKSRELLPREQQVTPEGEEDEEDPRWELIRQLVEYKKFKDAAAQLQGLEHEQENVYPRLPVKPEFESTPAPLRATVSIFDLINAVNAVLKRLSKQEDTREIFEDKWTVSEKIEELLALVQSREVVQFSDLFARASNRSEVVVTFLALLELIRLRQLVAVQEDSFGEISITAAPLQPPASAQTAQNEPAADSAGASIEEPLPVGSPAPDETLN